MKKKVLIVTRQMITGGVENALINMLQQVNYEKYDVDLYLQFKSGELLHKIPSNVNVFEIKSLKLKDFFNNPREVFNKYINLWKLKKNKYPFLEQCKMYSDMLCKLDKKYDIAISYHAPNTVPVFYVIDKVTAKEKILWLHGDLETNQGNLELAKRYHEKYAKVCGVSQSIVDSFIRHHPSMKNKVYLIHNVIDIEQIIYKASIGPTFKDNFKGIRILTIARLDFQKGIDIAIEVCNQLIRNNFLVKWYICGEGHDREKLEDKIKEYELQDYFVLLGNQSNPYTYLKDCDLYVQTSRFEGYCTTTNEARILYKPVITTDVSGAKEQFIHGKTGWIVPIDENSIYQQVVEVIKNPLLLDEISKNLNKLDFNSNSELDLVFKK